MPALPATYVQMYSELNSLIYNPSQRFFTPQDQLNYINRALVETANAIGGIRVIDTTNQSVSGQRDYELDDAVRQVIGVWYVKNFNTSTEKRIPLDVITFKDEDFISRIGWPWEAAFGIDSMNPQPVPRFAIFLPTLQTLRLLPAPADSGDTLYLDLLEIPNIQTNTPLSTYNGDTLEIGAVVYKAASLARIKSREVQESNVMEEKWKVACDGIKKMRGKMRRRRQLGDGRFFVTRLRSINGAE